MSDTPSTLDCQILFEQTSDKGVTLETMWEDKQLPREPLNGLNLRFLCLVLEKSWEIGIGMPKFERKLLINYLPYNKMSFFILGQAFFCTSWEEIADANRKRRLDLKDPLLHVTIDNLRKGFSLIYPKLYSIDLKSQGFSLLCILNYYE